MKKDDFSCLGDSKIYAWNKKIAHSERERAILVYGTSCSNGDQVAVVALRAVVHAQGVSK